MRFLSRARCVHVTTAVAVLGVGILLLAPIDLWLAVVLRVLDILGWDWTPGVEENPPVLGLDKVIHLALFFLLSWQVARSWRLLDPGRLWPALVACAVYGFALEVLQSLTGRTGDLMDVLADVAGVLAFVGCACVSSRSKSPS